MPKGHKGYHDGAYVIKYICEICESEGKNVFFKNRVASNFHMKINHPKANPKANPEISETIIHRQPINEPLSSCSTGGHKKKLDDHMAFNKK